MCTINVTVDDNNMVEEQTNHDMSVEELHFSIEQDIESVYDNDETIDLETARELVLKAVKEEYARP